MTKVIYPKAKEAFLKANLDLDGTVKIALIDVNSTAGYAYSAAHEFLSDVDGIIASSAALTGKTFTNGVFASDDASVIGVSGVDFEGLVFYIDTGTPSTSRLIAFEDEDIDGMPGNPNGGNFVIEMATAGWFTL